MKFIQRHVENLQRFKKVCNKKLKNWYWPPQESGWVYIQTPKHPIIPPPPKKNIYIYSGTSLFRTPGNVKLSALMMCPQFRMWIIKGATLFIAITSSFLCVGDIFAWVISLCVWYLCVWVVSLHGWYLCM